MTARDIAIWATIIVTFYGINSWRREHVGRRRMELVEDTLALFYEAKDAIRHIRNPMGYSSETESIEQLDNESEDAYKARKQASVVLVRYKEHEKLFNKIHSLRYRFMAQIGKTQSEPFNELNHIVNEILSSATVLAQLWARAYRQAASQDDETAQREHERRLKLEAVFWDNYGDDDPINPRLDNVINDIEATCYKVINTKGIFIDFFIGLSNRKK